MNDSLGFFGLLKDAARLAGKVVTETVMIPVDIAKAAAEGIGEAFDERKDNQD